MKTIDIYSKDEILMFHIGRGGQFRNPGHLTFAGNHEITDCYDWGQYTYERDRDELGRFCKKYLTRDNGNKLMNAEDYAIALNTGIGVLNFDEGYNTTYTTFLKDIDEREYLALDEDWQRIYQIVINEIPEDALDDILENDDLEDMFWFEYRD